MTLIIYDNTGYIYMATTGTYTVPQGGINYLELEVPTDKQVTSIDTSVTPNIPVYDDIKLTETQLLKKRIEEQEAALVELAEIIGGVV